MASESIGIDSESLLFVKLREYKSEIPHYNGRRKFTASLCAAIREKMAAAIDGGEDYFCIDSKPIEICRPACAKRCSMGKNEIEKAPSFGYCASQGVYYYGSLVSTKKS